MSAFDNVIGYDSIKSELLQICDMIHNKPVYEKLGAKLPQGVLLYGEPGLGKTTMARALIEECGIPTYTVRRKKGSDDFIGEIGAAFEAARDSAPAIVFLDDMDKFANEDDHHRDAEEYVAVQAAIDEVKDCGVFVLATVNELGKLPNSLVRAGRFDSKICFQEPSGEDAAKIITHYLAGKKVSGDVNMEDISKMIGSASCADLEVILNAAAISAAHARKDSIETEDLVEATLRMCYDAPDYSIRKSDSEIRNIALHEAGHLVVCEVLDPGSVGLASLRSKGRDTNGGFIRCCRDLNNRRHRILVSLASKAAVELYHSETCASGCQSDIHKAFSLIRDGLSTNATHGLALVDVETRRSPCMSETVNAASEAVVHAELERYMLKARDILLKNREFLEKARDALIEKETLLYSDIQKIRSSVKITEAAA